jgi:hypothetical protein
VSSQITFQSQDRNNEYESRQKRSWQRKKSAKGSTTRQVRSFLHDDSAPNFAPHRSIEAELLERLKQVSEGEIYNYPEKNYTKVLSKISQEEKGKCIFV